MANQIFEHDFSGNYPKVLARKMQFEALKNMFWGKFAKFNTPGARPVNPGNNPKPISSPIVIQHELEKQQGDIMEIPMHRNLDQLPTIGNNQLEGHEEEPKVNFAHVPLELWRHAEKPQDGSMSRQRNKDLRLLENTRPALLRHYARVNEYLGVSYAMYYGYSYNIIQSNAFANENYVGQAVSHPHIYVAGSGKVGYSGGYPGNSGYETTIGTDLSAVGSSDVFDTAFLNALKADPTVMKIPPLIMKDGNPLRLIVVHPWQIATLEADTAFNNTVNAAMAQAYAKDNPILFGCKYIYAGFAIFVSDTAVWPVNVVSGVPVWGPSSIQNLSSFEDYSGNTLFAGMILGDNAIFKAIGSRLQYKKRVADYGEVVGIAYRAIEGYSRGDYWNRDDGSKGQYLINQSSAIFVTYASAPAY